MINFAFYQRMRPILKDGAFNPSDYTPAELKMLFESLPVINSEYCNETFRLGALEYLKDHKAEYPHAHQLALKDVFTPPSQTFLPSLVARHETLDGAVAELETLKTPEQESDRIKVDLKKIYPIRDLFLGIHELEDYYAKWLCTQKGYSPNDLLDVIYYTNSLETVESLLRERKEAVYLEGGLGISNTWKLGKGFKNFLLQDRSENKLWYDLIALKGLEGVKITLKAHAELELLKRFILSHPEYSDYSEDFSSDHETGGAEPRRVKWKNLAIKLTAENVDAFCAELAEATETNYDAIEWPLDTKGLNKEDFLSLAKKYHMPSALLQRILDDELPSFNTQQDTFRNTLKPVFESIRLDSTDKPEKVIEGEVSFALKKAQTGKSNNLKVILQPKTSPIALFVGKMTDCCQFYKGHASDQMVIPVYTIPTVGLITLNQGSEVIGESFGWLTRSESRAPDGLVSESRAPDGLVLEAFTHVNSEGALMPLLKILAKGLRTQGLKLYLGAQEYKPSLSTKSEAGVITPVNKLPRPKPLSEDYQPYNHSKQVYLIDPETDYIPNFKIDQRPDAIKEQTLCSISEEVAIKLKTSPEISKIFIPKDSEFNPFLPFLPKLTVENIELLEMWIVHSENEINLGNISSILNLFSSVSKEVLEKLFESTELNKFVFHSLYSTVHRTLIEQLSISDLEKVALWNDNFSEKIDSGKLSIMYSRLSQFSKEVLERLCEFPEVVKLVNSSIHSETYLAVIAKLTEDDMKKITLWNHTFSQKVCNVNLSEMQTYLSSFSKEVLEKICKFPELVNIANEPYNFGYCDTKGFVTEFIGADIEKLALWNDHSAEKISNCRDIKFVLKIISQQSDEMICALAELPEILKFYYLSKENFHQIAQALTHDQRVKLSEIEGFRELFIFPSKIESYKQALDRILTPAQSATTEADFSGGGVSESKGGDAGDEAAHVVVVATAVAEASHGVIGATSVEEA